MEDVFKMNGCGSRFLYKAGDIVGGVYKVVRRLGKGGMGCVYEVEHPNLGIHYALKTFTMSSGRVELLRKRFLAEGKVLARLHHQNLVRVFDLNFDEASGTPFFVMDLVLDKDGNARTLDDLKQGEVDENQLLRWFVQLCSVLDYIHEKGVVHRDIKPSNILIDGNGCVVLTDFGISRYVTDELRKDLSLTIRIVSEKVFTSTMNIRMGTELFMAPEVKAGKPATAASDAYSLGLVFFHLLTGIWYSDRPGVFDLLDAMEKRWRLVLPWLLQKNAGLRPQFLMMAANDLCVEKLEPIYVSSPSYTPMQMDASVRRKLSWEDLCVKIALKVIRFPAFLWRIVRRVCKSLTMAADDMCVDNIGTSDVSAPSDTPPRRDASSRRKSILENLCVEIVFVIIRFPSFLSRVVRRARIRASGPTRIKLPRYSRFGKKSPLSRLFSSSGWFKSGKHSPSKWQKPTVKMPVKRVELPVEYQI